MKFDCVGEWINLDDLIRVYLLQRITSQSVNSQAVLRMMGRGAPPLRGRGGGFERGRGRGKY